MSKLNLIVIVGMAAAMLWPDVGATQTQTPSASVIYLVRHAETADDGTRDPALSEQGTARARRLGRMLAGAGLTSIRTTDYRRTRGTAAAVAGATGLDVVTYDPSALRDLAAELLRTPGRHLVVGHSNTTPALVQLLGGDPGGPISEDDHGRVYQLTLGPDGVHTALLGYPGGLLADPPFEGGHIAANPEDVASIDAIIGALYDAISGPAGQPRDWDRLRGLFLPSARMIPVQRAPDGSTRFRAITVEEYIEGSGPVLERMGFTERELERRVDRFGDVAQVFSSYEGHAEGQADPVASGINSIQLIHDGTRWWIASLAWSPTRDDLPLPEEYRP